MPEVYFIELVVTLCKAWCKKSYKQNPFILTFFIMFLR